MRRVVFLVLSSTLFGSAVAWNRQAGPTAEQQFKNIQSFKGAKGSDIIPAMKFMSASLGVECSFCHTQDFSSDEKRPKGTAREMIAMQRDINTRNFNGRNIVTCASCHGGHTRPVPYPPVAGLADRTQGSRDVVPAAVLDAYAKVAGGDPAHPLDRVRLKGTVEIKGEKNPVEAMYAGGRYAYVVHAPKGDENMGFNGTLVWSTSPERPFTVPLMYAVSLVNEKTLMAGPGALPKLENMTGRTSVVAGRDQLVVAGTEADQTRVSLFFDKGTGLLTRSEYFYPSILGSIAQINDFSDYRKIDGVMLPMRVANHDAEGDAVYEFRSAHVDPKLKPEDIQPPK